MFFFPTQIPSSTHCCPHCGKIIASFSGCQNCMKRLGKKSSSISGQQLVLAEKSEHSSPTTNVTAKNSLRLCAQNIQLVRKSDQTQCVTLSSDEEDYQLSYPECKKLKEDVASNQKDYLSSDLPRSNGNKSDREMVAGQLNNIQPDVPSLHLTTLSESENQATPIGVEPSNEEDDHEFSSWNQTVSKGPFTTLQCQSIQIGSLKVVPTSPVLLSSETIVLKFSSGNASEQSSSDTPIAVTIFKKDLLLFEAHFSHHLPAIFLYIMPKVSRQYSQKLGLQKNILGGPYWDTLSSVESQKRLILLPECLTKDIEESIKQAFTGSGVFHEISFEKANQILLKSSPVNHADEVPKSIQITTKTSSLIPVGIRKPRLVTAVQPVVAPLKESKSTILPHSSQNISNKGTGILKEVTFTFT